MNACACKRRSTGWCLNVRPGHRPHLGREGEQARTSILQSEFVLGVRVSNSSPRPRYQTAVDVSTCTTCWRPSTSSGDRYCAGRRLESAHDGTGSGDDQLRVCEDLPWSDQHGDRGDSRRNSVRQSGFRFRVPPPRPPDNLPRRRPLLRRHAWPRSTQRFDPPGPTPPNDWNVEANVALAR